MVSLGVPGVDAAQKPPSAAQRDRLWLHMLAHAHVFSREWISFGNTTPVYFPEARASSACDGRSRTIPRHVIDAAKQRGLIRGTRTAGLGQRVRASETPVIVELGGVCAQRGDTFFVSLQVAPQWPGPEGEELMGGEFVASYRFVWQHQRWRYVDTPFFGTPALVPASHSTAVRRPPPNWRFLRTSAPRHSGASASRRRACSRTASR
jgi:hypothetical protein